MLLIPVYFTEDITLLRWSGPTAIVPSMSVELKTAIPLICGLEPETPTPGLNYTTRWILPGGEIVNSSRGCYSFSEIDVSISGKDLSGTILIVTESSYQDAGMYTCEGRSTDPGASAQWAAASIELQLNCVVSIYSC